MPEVYLIGNSNDLEIVTLTKRSDGSAVTGATCTLDSLTDKDGSAVTGGNTLPATITHISAGSYTLMLKGDFVVTEGQMYYATVSVDAGSDLIASWTIAVHAVKRRV